MMNPKKMALLEAMLFTTTEPLSLDNLEKRLRIRKEAIEKMIQILKEKYTKEDVGIELSDIGGFRLVVKPEFMENVSDLTPHADMSRGLLRVLAIIAYHQPISQSDIVKVIGNRTYDYVKDLEQKGLVKWEKKSRTKMLSVTPHFEEYFGAKAEEIKKVLAEMKEEAEIKKQGEE